MLAHENKVQQEQAIFAHIPDQSLPMPRAVDQYSLISNGASSGVDPDLYLVGSKRPRGFLYDFNWNYFDSNLPLDINDLFPKFPLDEPKHAEETTKDFKETVKETPPM